VGNGVIAGGGARAEQRRLFAQPRVLAAQRSPVKARHVPARSPRLRRDCARRSGTASCARGPRYSRGYSSTAVWAVPVACRSAAAAQVRRGDRRLLCGTRAVPVEHDGAAAARGRRQRTHVPAGALLGTHSSPSLTRRRCCTTARSCIASSASTPRRSATTPRYAGPGADVDSPRSRRRCGRPRRRPTTGPTRHSRVYY
jgi:hypothetical protein